ncbi:hypothetical protein AC792_00470 [Arthrobacter sp. RIT-PI-e]|uniref:hypothetical protein n=1 Tax=Arthrobacter sp. RIT-PI-e TaxID=1681197 RepID=UPI000676909E|nr:hypothetical protein [Arthrobacter sp. RIT-PI-e]KNC20465.1 hypothetical protein AC792_00470 [Arthrobacter sp. RIT-PI-e]
MPSNASPRTDRTASHEASTTPNASWKEAAFGDDRPGNPRNISWGAVIAGVVTFLALTILLSLITATLGLGLADLDSGNPGEGVGIATGISSIITLALALAAGGYVAGALSARSGLIHGFLTWATSLLAIVVLAGLLVGNVLGAAGSILGSTASTVSDAVTQNPQQAADAAPDVSAAEASQAASDAQDEVARTAQENAPEAEEAADTAAAGTLWTFFGLLIGAVVASFTGLLGSRSVTGTRVQETTSTRRK